MANNLQAICPKCKFSYTIPLDKQLVRTIPQNKLYWPVYVHIVADHLGYFPDEIMSHCICVTKTSKQVSSTCATDGIYV